MKTGDILLNLVAGIDILAGVILKFLETTFFAQGIS